MDLSRPRVLVTGFEPNDDGINSSQVLVESLAAEPLASLAVHEIHYAVLPGDTHALHSALLKLMEEHEPNLCLLAGQDPGGSRVKFERLATNLRDFMVPDRAGNREAGSRILEDAPAAYFSTLGEPARLAQVLLGHGIAAAPSNHAGNHLCNQALFLALHFAAQSGKSLRAGFMHIPLLPAQVSGRWDDRPSMPLVVLREAAALATRCAVEMSSAGQGAA